MQFPTVRGSNLLRQNVQIPADLGGQLNLLFVPFQQWQQMEVNSWGALMEQLEQDHPGFRYYELPTIQRYLDKKAFRRALGMPDEEHTYLLLTDRAGNILWRSGGEYTAEKAAQLVIALNEISLQTEPA